MQHVVVSFLSQRIFSSAHTLTCVGQMGYIVHTIGFHLGDTETEYRRAGRSLFPNIAASPDTLISFSSIALGPGVITPVTCGGFGCTGRPLVRLLLFTCQGISAH